MSLNFSAQQYDAPFKPRRLGNWEVPKTFPQLPRFQSRMCQPEFVANERGHLRPELKCRRKNPFCNYIGTYQLPRRITREVAKKLSRFPHDYSVINDINDSLYTPCRVIQKCIRPANEKDQHERFRQIVRKCVRESADNENIENVKVGDSKFGKKVKSCIGFHNQSMKEKERFRNMAKKCITENANENMENSGKVGDEQFVEKVTKCIDYTNKALKEVTGEHRQETEDLTENLRNQVNQRIEDTMNKKSDNNIEQDLKDYIKQNLQQEDKENNDLGKYMKDEIKRSLQEKDIVNKDNERGGTNDELKKIVQKCIQENEKYNKDNVDSKQIKEKIKDCVKKTMRTKETKKEDILRGQVQKCIEDQQNLTQNITKRDFKERVRECVQKENEKPEENKHEKDAMRETVKECMKKYKSEANTLKKHELKDKIKNCVYENYKKEDKFRQAVRECIPDNIGKDNFEKNVKDCANEKIKGIANTNASEKKPEEKERLRNAVQECIKEKRENKKSAVDKSDPEFKKEVKACALQKLKTN